MCSSGTGARLLYKVSVLPLFVCSWFAGILQDYCSSEVENMMEITVHGLLSKCEKWLTKDALLSFLGNNNDCLWSTFFGHY